MPVLHSSPRRSARRPTAFASFTLSTALAAVLFTSASAQAASRPTLPVLYNPAGGVAQTLLAPESPPPGANDWSCRPTAAHPLPVVLVNGTFEVMAFNWNTLSPLLYNRGYCVFAFNYGGIPGSPVQATGDIVQSAGQLSAFIDRVRAATGVSEVDLVGHSQGGMMPRYYLKYLGGAAKVNKLIGLAPSNHGTTVDGIFALSNGLGLLGITNVLLNPACTACVQQQRGSPFINNLNAGGDTVAGVTYTVIETVYDEVVTPYQSAFLSGPNVTNITLQDRCAIDFVGHIGISFDKVALTHVLNALDPAHRVPVPCGLVLPGV